MNDFDLKAADWDKNPMVWERSKAIANEIINLIPLTKEMRALEFGAGTGITSFLLKDRLKEITLMDSSREMVRVMNEKIDSSKVINLKAICFNLENEEFKDDRFDLIFTQMVLHHVNDIDSIIRVFYQLLNKGSYLAIVDLYKEDGSFHGDGFTGHNGFNMDPLSDILRKNGFSDISHKPCFVIDREISETESKQFEVFIMVAKKE
jgi:ubiquinone/menaquinone biosynthesis C-methylase UbiE